MSVQHWIQINGFSNLFSGWGKEDDDLGGRLFKNDLMKGPRIYGVHGDQHEVRRPIDAFCYLLEDSGHTPRNYRNLHRNSELLEKTLISSEWKTEGINSLNFSVAFRKHKSFVPNSLSVLWLGIRFSSTIALSSIRVFCDDRSFAFGNIPVSMNDFTHNIARDCRAALHSDYVILLLVPSTAIAVEADSWSKLIRWLRGIASHNDAEIHIKPRSVLSVYPWQPRRWQQCYGAQGLPLYLRTDNFNCHDDERRIYAVDPTDKQLTSVTHLCVSPKGDSFTKPPCNGYNSVYFLAGNSHCVDKSATGIFSLEISEHENCRGDLLASFTAFDHMKVVRFVCYQVIGGEIKSKLPMRDCPGRPGEALMLVTGLLHFDPDRYLILCVNLGSVSVSTQRCPEESEVHYGLISNEEISDADNFCANISGNWVNLTSGFCSKQDNQMTLISLRKRFLMQMDL